MRSGSGLEHPESGLDLLYPPGQPGDLVPAHQSHSLESIPRVPTETGHLVGQILSPVAGPVTDLLGTVTGESGCGKGTFDGFPEAVGYGTSTRGRSSSGAFGSGRIFWRVCHGPSVFGLIPVGESRLATIPCRYESNH